MSGHFRMRIVGCPVCVFKNSGPLRQSLQSRLSKMTCQASELQQRGSEGGANHRKTFPKHQETLIKNAKM